MILNKLKMEIYIIYSLKLILNNLKFVESILLY